VVRLDDAVAVVADDTWAAKRGLAALDIRWDEGPNATLSTADIVLQLATASQKAGVVARKQGDAAGAMAGAAQKVEAIYELPFLAHATMEPVNCTVHVQPDGCDVWVGTQVPTFTQNGRGESDRSVEIQGPGAQPSAGRRLRARLEVDFITRAVQVAKQVNGPVQVVWSRGRGHPARHVPAVLLRPHRRRPGRARQADRVDTSGHRIVHSSARVSSELFPKNLR